MAKWRKWCAVFVMRGMNIAIIHSRLNSKGGTQRKVLAVALALQELGHTVTVYAMAYDPAKCYPSFLDRLTVVSLEGYNDKAHKSKKPFFAFFNYFIYSRNETRAARMLAKQIRADTELLCPFDRLGYRVATHYKKKIRSIPSVAIMDDIYTKLWASWRKSQFDPSYALPWRRKMFFKCIDWYETKKYILPHERIVVLDSRTKKWVKDFFCKEADIVRNGLMISDFPYVVRTAQNKNSVRLLSTGIFFLHRRYEDIIDAVKILRDQGIGASLTLVGGYSGEHHRYYETLKSKVDKFGFQNVVFFLGNISDLELRNQYEKNDIYVSANHLQSWGLAPFEAIASGMPAIISNTTGASEVLVDRKNAILIPPKSPEKIAESIKIFLENPEVYKHISEGGRRFVEEHITWGKTAEDLVCVFKTVLKKT